MSIPAIPGMGLSMAPASDLEMPSAGHRLSETKRGCWWPDRAIGYRSWHSVPGRILWQRLGHPHPNWVMPAARSWAPATAMHSGLSSPF